MNEIILPQKRFIPSDVVSFIREQGYEPICRNGEYYREMTDGSYAVSFYFGPVEQVLKRNPRRFWFRKHVVQLPQQYAGLLFFTLSQEMGPWMLYPNFLDQASKDKFGVLANRLRVRFYVSFIDK